MTNKKCNKKSSENLKNGFSELFCAVHAKNDMFHAKIDTKPFICDILYTTILEDRRARQCGRI